MFLLTQLVLVHQHKATQCPELASLPLRACGAVSHRLNGEFQNKPEALEQFLELLPAAGGAIKSLKFVSVAVACHS